MAQPVRRTPSDREIIVLGVVCMVLSAGLCLALSLWLGQGDTDRREEIKRRMSMMVAGAVAPGNRPAVSGEYDRATMRPAQMQVMMADMNRAEMDLRLRRGIAMVVSMALGLAIFVGLRALRSRPVGPLLFAREQRGTA